MFAPPSVEQSRQTDGSLVLRSRQALQEPARIVGEHLVRWAAESPQLPFLMERSTPGGDWRGVTYAQALQEVVRVAGWLLEQDLSADRPVMILSENSVEHGLLMLACMHVGIPVSSVSPAYSLISKDFRKLDTIVQTLDPGVIYAASSARFGPALEAIEGKHNATLVVGSQPGNAGLAFDALLGSADAVAVQRASAALTPDSIAKFLFTSGSTAEPKGVITTQRMLCSNQQAISQIWPFVEDKPVLVDWLPWHHTFGGSHNFNLVLRNGGTLYIDGGRPVAGKFEETLANLRDVAPTIFLNVPRAYDLLVRALREDAGLRKNFFSRLKLIFYAAAALPQHLWQALEELSQQTLGHKLPMVSSWGLTETAPMATSCHFPVERSGVIGVPIPGSELKLVPCADKLEARVRGPNVTPGYWKRPELTAKFFDEQGFFKTGDAVRFVDPEEPSRGLLFDGRIGEDFKLSTGTWVSVGALRVRAIEELAPVAQDVVITGHDRDEIGLLIFPNFEACRELCSAECTPQQSLESPVVREHVQRALQRLRVKGRGSSTFATRAMLLQDPPSIDDSEITDKGYINQRAVLTCRAALVDALYEMPADVCVIKLATSDPSPER